MSGDASFRAEEKKKTSIKAQLDQGEFKKKFLQKYQTVDQLNLKNLDLTQHQSVESNNRQTKLTGLSKLQSVGRSNAMVEEPQVESC